MDRLIVLVLSLASVPLFFSNTVAQSRSTVARPWQFQSFNDDAGLDEKTVTHGAVDSSGSIWLAVTDGLYHFDGYRWKRYTTDHGLPSNYVRCILVKSDGGIWVGTDKGAALFDGTGFDSNITLGEIAGPSVRRIVEDPDGGIWFCCDQWPVGDVKAGLSRLKAGQFRTWRQSDGLPSDYVSDYVRDSQGRQFVLTNQGLAQITEDGFVYPLKEAGLWEEDTYVWSLVESEIHGLVASTDEHLYQYRDDRWERFPHAVPGAIQIKLVAASDGEIFTCPFGRGPTIYRWDGGRFVVASRRLTDVTGGVDHIFEDSQGAIWIAGFEKLLRWERNVSQWQIYRDVGRPLLNDGQGGVWFEASGEGLVRLENGRWRTYSGVSTPICNGNDGRVWMTSSEGIAFWEGGQIHQIEVEEMAQAEFLDLDGAGTLWTCAEDESGASVIATYHDGRWRTQALDEFGEQQQVLRWSPDPNSGIWVVLGRNNFPPFRLLHCTLDGYREIELPDRVQVSDPPKVLALKNRTLLVYGFFGLMQQDVDSLWRTVRTPAPVVGQIVELDQEVWATCRGKLGGRAGLMRLRDGVWRPFLERRGQFVGQNRDIEVYVSSQGELSVVTAGTDSLAAPIATTPFETRVNKVVVGTAEGTNTGPDYWVGVSNRAYRYVPNSFPPETEIAGGSKNLTQGDELVLRVKGLERFKPAELKRSYLVSYRVDENDWSEFETLDGEIRIPALTRGDHRVQVRVQNAARQIDPSPAEFSTSVFPLPLQSRAWFRPAVLLCFTTILALAIMALINWKRVGRMASELEREVVRKTGRLSASEREFRLLFEDSQDAICLFDVQGELKNSNSAANELFGENGKGALDDIFLDNREALRFRRDLQYSNELRGARYRMRDSKGEPFDAILSVNTRTGENGQRVGYQVIVRDISTLVELQKQLSEINKMEAIGRMAGGIAHDFNNFLAVVMYGADFVRLKAKGDTGIEEGVQMIFDAAERGRSLTSQIQTFSRTPAANLQVINTYDVLSDLPGLIQGILPENVLLDFVIEDEISNIRADAHQLEQVLVNLAVNSCHAMPDGGKLSIQAGNVGEKSNGEQAAESSGPTVLIQVLDTGQGMDAATRDRIFDPFFTTKPHGQGTGLGLAIVYGIVKQFGGQIVVNSEVGKGSRFEIYLPATNEPVKNESGETVVTNPPRGNESILLVEDEPVLRDMALESLMRLGYQVHVAEDGLVAKQLIESGMRLDLVVSDVVMPGMTGIELVKWIHAEDPGFACLLITGYADPIAQNEIDSIGVPCLKKPFLPSTLAVRVRDVLDQKLTPSRQETP